MNRLRRRIEALERCAGDVFLTAEELAALGSDDPALRDLAQRAMIKEANRHGLERLILASFQPAVVAP